MKSIENLFLQIGGGSWSSVIMQEILRIGYLIALTDKNQKSESILMQIYFLILMAKI